MKKVTIALLSTLLLVTLVYKFLTHDFDHATPTLFTNGNLITLNEKMPIAEAMIVRNGLIEAIGTALELKTFEPAPNQIVDLNGATILPGFIDVHTHFALSLFFQKMHDLSGFKHNTNQDVWAHFEDIVATSKPGDWIICKGLDPILVRDLKTPSLAYLDKIAPENPVFILSKSIHNYWANSIAFEKADIHTNSLNPSVHSYYEKDQDGKLTGHIVEQEAVKPFLNILSNEVITPSVLSEVALDVMKGYVENGNTSIVSTGLSITDKKSLILTKHLSDKTKSLLGGLLEKLGMLPKRKPFPRHFIYMRHDMAHLLPDNVNSGNDFYGIIGVKHWYDGSPYVGSMYLQDPYLNNSFTRDELHIPPGYKGKPLLQKDALKEFITNYHKMGWQIAIHTQGDAAIREVVDAYDSLSTKLDFSNSRHRLEHCLLLPDDQFKRMVSLNLTPSFHINHLYYYGDGLNNDILGPERTAKILPLQSAKKQNILYTLHADQPMFESEPFRLIQTAVERKTINGTYINTEENIELMEALKAITINAAWQINMEDKLGSLEKGKYADFVILDRDPFNIPIEELDQMNCIATYINGNKFY